jgi:hypothetical protein
MQVSRNISSSADSIIVSVDLSQLPPAHLFKLTDPGEDSGWKRRYDLLLGDFWRLHSQYIEGHMLRRDDRNALIAESKQREAAEMHCAIARQEINRLQYQLNTKEQNARQPAEKIKVKGGGLLTTTEALAERDTAKEAKEAKEKAARAKDAEAKAKEDEDADRRRRIAQAGVTHQFSDKLSKYQKRHWVDLAHALALPYDKKHTIANLRDNIYQCFLSTYPLQVDSRFSLVWQALVALHADQLSAPPHKQHVLDVVGELAVPPLTPIAPVVSSMTAEDMVAPSSGPRRLSRGRERPAPFTPRRGPSSRAHENTPLHLFSLPVPHKDHPLSIDVSPGQFYGSPIPALRLFSDLSDSPTNLLGPLQ